MNGSLKIRCGGKKGFRDAVKSGLLSCLLTKIKFSLLYKYMKEREGFTILELLVVISIIGILASFQVPNFQLLRERARQTAVKANMRYCQVAIETFYLERGYYADDFYEDGYGYVFPGGVFEVKIGKLPTNPYTGKTMEPEDFNEEDYDNKEDCANTQEGGPNDIWGYEPGQMRYGVYYPPGMSEPSNWGLVGIDRYGQSIRSWTAEDEIQIFVLHN